MNVTMEFTKSLCVILMCVTAVTSNIEDAQIQCFIGTPPKLNYVSCATTTAAAVAISRGRRQLNTTTSPQENVNSTVAIQVISNVSEIDIEPYMPTVSTLLFDGDVDLHDDEDDVESTTVTSSDVNRGRPNSCLVFLPQRSAGNESTTTRAQFACDLDGICEENYKYMSNHRVNVTYRGQLGDLYCCRGTGCNMHHNAFPSHLPILANRPLQCSAGPNVKDSILCPNETLACFNETVFTRTTTNDSYGCDLTNYCVKQNLKNDTCLQLVNSDGLHTSICCCFANNCNAPPEIIVKTDRSFHTSDLGKIKWITYGWIALVTISLAVVAIVLVVRWRRNRMYSYISVISDPRYQRLTANFIAGDTDDVKMLLAD